MKQNKIAKILFYVSACIMIFSIFMFFIQATKWDVNTTVGALFKEWDIALPNLFDLMFGAEGSKSVGNWPVVGGLLVVFILQIIVILGSLTATALLCLKKIDFKKASTILVGCAVVALVCGILTFTTKSLIGNKVINFTDYHELVPGKVEIDFGKYSLLGAGPIVYGSTMIVASITACVAYLLNKFAK